jgi:RNA polymerase sigma factor (sigma-70 family)
MYHHEPAMIVRRMPQVPWGSMPTTLASDEGDSPDRTDAGAHRRREHDQLLALLRSGGKARQAAVKALYERYERPFRQFFRRHRLSLEAAEDLVQDTFVRVVQAIESYRAEGAFDAWLWTIARNTLMSHLRERKADVSLDEMEPDEADGLLARLRPGGSNPAAADCVKRSFEQYSNAQPECAEALMRIVVDGWRYEELAQYRSSTYGATREYLSQCRKRLMDFVQPCFELSEGR